MPGRLVKPASGVLADRKFIWWQVVLDRVYHATNAATMSCDYHDRTSLRTNIVSCFECKQGIRAKVESRAITRGSEICSTDEEGNEMRLGWRRKFIVLLRNRNRIYPKPNEMNRSEWLSLSCRYTLVLSVRWASRSVMKRQTNLDRLSDCN